MGYFDCRCAISGLPLKAGDPLRFILLTSNGDPDSRAHRACYSGDWWSPRTMPIKARYNDYGGVEDVQEGLCRDLWAELLNKDLVEKGTGDNQCHDVPVTKDLTFEDLLEPIWEGRLEVYGCGYRPRVVHVPDAEGEEKYTQPEWLPTIRSVTELLPSSEKFLVDDLEYGAVRVRSAKFTDTKGSLKAAKKALEKRFAVAVTAGSGNYSFGEAELRVFSPPVKEASIGRRSALPETQQISFAMIREDVWQAILKLPLLQEWGPSTPLDTTAESCRAEVTEYYQKTVEHYRELETLKKKHEDLKKQGDSEASEALGAWVRLQMEYGSTRIDEAPYLLSGRSIHGPIVNPTTHWNAVAQKQLPLDVVRDFVDSAAELVYVTHVLNHLEYRWIPTTTAGQGGNFREFENFYEAMRDVARQCAEEREAMYEEY